MWPITYKISPALGSMWNISGKWRKKERRIFIAFVSKLVQLEYGRFQRGKMRIFFFSFSFQFFDFFPNYYTLKMPYNSLPFTTIHVFTCFLNGTRCGGDRKEDSCALWFQSYVLFSESNWNRCMLLQTSLSSWYQKSPFLCLAPTF